MKTDLSGERWSSPSKNTLELRCTKRQPRTKSTKGPLFNSGPELHVSLPDRLLMRAFGLGADWGKVNRAKAIWEVAAVKAWQR